VERSSAPLISAAGCSSHAAPAMRTVSRSPRSRPAALIKGAELRSTCERLDAATAEAVAAGVRDVPAIQIGEHVFSGPNALEEARASQSLV